MTTTSCSAARRRMPTAYARHHSPPPMLVRWGCAVMEGPTRSVPALDRSIPSRPRKQCQSRLKIDKQQDVAAWEAIQACARRRIRAGERAARSSLEPDWSEPGGGRPLGWTLRLPVTLRRRPRRDQLHDRVSDPNATQALSGGPLSSRLRAFPVKPGVLTHTATLPGGSVDARPAEVGTFGWGSGVFPPLVYSLWVWILRTFSQPWVRA